MLLLTFYVYAKTESCLESALLQNKRTFQENSREQTASEASKQPADNSYRQVQSYRKRVEAYTSVWGVVRARWCPWFLRFMSDRRYNFVAVIG